MAQAKADEAIDIAVMIQPAGQQTPRQDYNPFAFFGRRGIIPPLNRCQPGFGSAEN
jgi:hypothetical protein